GDGVQGPGDRHADRTPGRTGPADSAGGSRRRADWGVVGVKKLGAHRLKPVPPSCWLLATGCWLLSGAAPLFAQTVTLLPSRVELKGPNARQQLIAEAAVGERQEDWTRSAQWSSADPAIATVDEHGLIRPAGDGEVRITARAKGLSASVTVTVRES